VSDDGRGFSDKDLCEATKPFYKAAESAAQEHLGMGLNICKVLCEKHGGFLTLKNKGGAAVTAAFRAV
jgi:signal transduction histidine kinase